MRKLFVLAALGVLLATPAFAQQVPDDGPNAGQHRRSTVPPGGIYYGRNAGASDASRWKTNPKAKQHARQHHHHSAHKK